MATLPFEVIVMAGGRGERLSPLTDNCPKPLLLVGDRPILEYSILRLIRAGIKDFSFCVNYLGEQIEGHFGDGERWNARFTHIYEPRPLGTIGGAALKTNFRFEDLLVINGDLLTTINYEKFYAFFLEEEADIAVATIPYRVNLPYGILHQNDQREVTHLDEKPSYTYYINSGMYFLRKEILELIPENTRLDAVALIHLAIDRGCKISAFPLRDYWLDIGQMEDFKRAQEDIQFIDW